MGDIETIIDKSSPSIENLVGHLQWLEEVTGFFCRKVNAYDVDISIDDLVTLHEELKDAEETVLGVLNDLGLHKELRETDDNKFLAIDIDGNRFFY